MYQRSAENRFSVASEMQRRGQARDVNHVSSVCNAEMRAAIIDADVFL